LIHFYKRYKWHLVLVAPQPNLLLVGLEVPNLLLVGLEVLEQQLPSQVLGLEDLEQHLHNLQQGLEHQPLLNLVLGLVGLEHQPLLNLVLGLVGLEHQPLLSLVLGLEDLAPLPLVVLGLEALGQQLHNHPLGLADLAQLQLSLQQGLGVSEQQLHNQALDLEGLEQQLRSLVLGLVDLVQQVNPVLEDLVDLEPLLLRQAQGLEDLGRINPLGSVQHLGLQLALPLGHQAQGLEEGLLPQHKQQQTLASQTRVLTLWRAFTTQCCTATCTMTRETPS